MMVSPLSGSNRDIELVKIETADLSLTIKGNPYHEKYESLKKHQSIASDEMMHFHVSGTSDSIMVYDAQLQKLSELTEHPLSFSRIGVISSLSFLKMIKNCLFTMSIHLFERQSALLKWVH